MKSLAKILVSLLTLLFIGLMLDWGALLESTSRLKWWALPVTISLQVCAFIVGSRRWFTLLRAQGLDITHARLVQPYFTGAFFNTFLPSSTGGDAYRIYHIHRSKHGTAAAFSPVITERFLGFASQLLISFTAFLFYAGDHPAISHVSHAVAGLLLVTVLLIPLVGSSVLYKLIRQGLNRWSGRTLIREGLKITDAGHEYLSCPRLVGKIVLISLLMHSIIVVEFFVLGKAVGSDLPLETYFLIVPLVLLSAGLPIAIGGLGVREGAGILLFTAAGMTQGDAAVVVLLFIPTLLIASMPGLFFFLRKKAR